MAEDISDLPSPGQDISDLPAPPAQQDHPSWMRTIAGSAVSGVTSLAGLPGSLVHTAGQLASEGMSKLDAAITGRDSAASHDAGHDWSGENDIGTGANLEKLAGKTGLATGAGEGASTAQRYVGAGVNAVVGGFLTGGLSESTQAAQVLQKTPEALTVIDRMVQQFPLMERPWQELGLVGRTARAAAPAAILNASAGISSQAAADAGLGPAGSLLASLAPGAVVYGSVYGSNLLSNPKRAQEVINEHMAATGEMPTAGETGNPLLGAIQRMQVALPGSAGRYWAKTQQLYSAASDRFGAILDAIAPNRTPSDVGGAVVGNPQDATGGVKYGIEQLKSNADQLFTRAAAKQADIGPVSIKGTYDFLKSLTPSTEGYEVMEARRLAEDPTLRWLAGERSSLEQQLVVNEFGGVPVPKPGSLSYDLHGHSLSPDEFHSLPPGMQQQARQIETPPSYQLKDGSTITTEEFDRRMGAALNDPKLDVNNLTQFKREVGQKLGDPSLVAQGLNQAKLTQYWGQIASDHMTALEEGSEAWHATQTANSYYQNTVLPTQERLQRIVQAGTNGGTMADVYQQVMSGTQKSGERLNTVLDAVSKENQNTVIAGVLDHLGKASPGKQTWEGTVWSPEQYITNWNGLHEDARAALTSRMDPKLVQGLDDLGVWASRLKDNQKMLANPSGTSRSGLYIGAVASASTSALGAAWALLTGHPIAAAAGAAPTAMIGVNYNVAKLMTSPTFVKWLATSRSVPTNMTRQYAAVLAQQAQKMKDADMAHYALALQQYYDQQNKQQPPQQ